MTGVEVRTVAERVRFVFGDVAEQILRIEEQKLGIPSQNPLTEKDLQRLADDLQALSQRMAGEELSRRVREEVLKLAQPPAERALAGGPGRSSP